MTKDTCWTSIPRAQTSVVIKTRLYDNDEKQKYMRLDCTYEVPLRNSAMMASRSFWTISPCIDDTVKLAARIFSVSQSTLNEVLLSVNHRFAAA